MMAKIKRSDMRIVDDAFDMHGGYVLDFTNRTFSEFFEDELGIDIYCGKYAFNGTSKANHLRAFIEAESPQLVSRALRALWRYREEMPGPPGGSAEEKKDRLFKLLGRIEAGLGGRVASAQPQRAWTKEEDCLRLRMTTYLDDSSEDEITEKLLLPLFQQLGFRRITVSGHKDKNLEYGKDVWMKYVLPTSHSIYFGLQVKKGKLDAAGRSKYANIAEVHAQVLMMLGHPVFDPETNKEHLVDHALIVCGGDITKQARNWLGRQLDASQRSQILFMERKDILDLLVIHKTPFPESTGPRSAELTKTVCDPSC